MSGAAQPWCKVFLAVLLLAGFACKRPETALRERPAQRVELIQKLEGMTPGEAAAAEGQLAAGMGCAPASAEPLAGPERILRLTLTGRPNPAAAWGLGQTWAASTGTGCLAGALVVLWPGVPGTTFEVAAIGMGLGGLAGFAYGPTQYRHNQTRLQALGYLPWALSGSLEVLDRAPGGLETLVARKAVVPLDLGPHLRPLPPEARTPMELREASVQAYLAALVARLRGAQRP